MGSELFLEHFVKAFQKEFWNNSGECSERVLERVPDIFSKQSRGAPSPKRINERMPHESFWRVTPNIGKY